MWVIEQATRCSTLSEYKGNRVLELAIETVELSEGPLHLKMWRSIQDRIVSVDWPPLFQFPSESELAHQPPIQCRPYDRTPIYSDAPREGISLPPELGHSMHRSQDPG
jgi:hypothetical protein